MTKKFYFIFIFVANYCFSQSVDYNDFRYKDLSFYSSKTEIENVLGKPIRFFEPNYECGFLSSYEQETDYYTLKYDNIQFTGNDSEKYIIEKISFDKNDVKLTYKNHILSNKTTFKELEEILKNTIRVFVDDSESIYLQCNNCDDGIILKFKNNRLISFEYWSPC